MQLPVYMLEKMSFLNFDAIAIKFKYGFILNYKYNSKLYKPDKK